MKEGEMVNKKTLINASPTAKWRALYNVTGGFAVASSIS
jgi:hypothetical protein